MDQSEAFFRSHIAVGSVARCCLRKWLETSAACCPVSPLESYWYPPWSWTRLPPAEGSAWTPLPRYWEWLAPRTWYRQLKIRRQCSTKTCLGVMQLCTVLAKYFATSVHRTFNDSPSIVKIMFHYKVQVHLLNNCIALYDRLNGIHVTASASHQNVKTTKTISQKR